MVKIHLNGEVRDLTRAGTVATLLDELALPAQRIAVEVNGKVVRRSDWDATTIADDDRVEIVHFVGGG